MESTVVHNCFFNCNVCHVCKVLKKELWVCSNCKTTRYCSGKHQRLDWKYHKKICSVISKTNSLLEHFSVKSFDEFVEQKKISYALWKKELQRDLYDHEMQMWMFPRACEVCFSRKVTTNCQNCHNVCYCSEEHEASHYEQHQKHCAEFKLSLELDIECYNAEIDSHDIVVSDINGDFEFLPETLQELMQLYDKTYSIDECRSVRMILKSNHVSPVATILYGLESGGYLFDRTYHKEDLTVHIVGANTTELVLPWKTMFELPFHWIRNLKSLEYILIGPELPYNYTIDKYTKDLCNSCQLKKVKTLTTFHTQLYHNIVNSLKQPDVVIAFNSGLHEFQDQPEMNSWKDSIPSLLQYRGVPLILTAYTSGEIVQDLALVEKDVSCVIWRKPHKNPFCYVKPLKNFDSQYEPIYHSNGYITVLSKR